MRHFSTLILFFWSILFLGNVAIILYSYRLPKEKYYAPKRALANRFLLTDYCLSTESRHTRHIALPEPIAPFQDLPAYHEHFPSSSFLWSPAGKPLFRGLGEAKRDKRKP